MYGVRTAASVGLTLVGNFYCQVMPAFIATATLTSYGCCCSYSIYNILEEPIYPPRVKTVAST